MATVLLVILLITVAALFIYKNTMFSTDALSIKITGPIQAGMGDEIEYTVTYKNIGNFVMENPKLVFTLPDNSLTEDNTLRFTQKVKDISPGEENALSFKVRLLGKEGDVKTAKASLTYNPHNLSVRYESDADIKTTINAVATALVYDMPLTPIKGQTMTYSLQYASSVDYPLENISIKLDKIEGFTFKSSNPASLDSNEYKLPTLMLGQGGKINIMGIINSDAPDNLHFVARLGKWVDGTFVVIKETVDDVFVVEPPAPIETSPVDILPILQ